MRYQIVDESTINEILKNAYNPPEYSKHFSEENFLEEYWKFHKHLKRSISEIGNEPVPGNYDDRDFTMNDDFEESRGISIELNTRKLWTHEFIKIVGSCLAETPQRYSVYVDHSLFEDPFFCLFITCDEVLGYADDCPILCRFGF